MSTWVVQVVVVALFALTCGALAAAWIRGRLGVAAIALFLVALAVWVVAFAAIAAEFGDANGFATCVADCSTVHYVSAVAFLVASAAHRARGAGDARRTQRQVASQAIAGAGEQQG